MHKYVKNITLKYIIKETNDEVPNLGFSLSNIKLKNSGFKFLYNLDESYKEMTLNGLNRKLLKDLEYVKKGEDFT